jgi:hypothetical protein
MSSEILWRLVSGVQPREACTHDDMMARGNRQENEGLMPPTPCDQMALGRHRLWLPSRPTRTQKDVCDIAQETDID